MFAQWSGRGSLRHPSLYHLKLSKSGSDYRFKLSDFHGMDTVAHQRTELNSRATKLLMPNGWTDHSGNITTLQAKSDYSKFGLNRPMPASYRRPHWHHVVANCWRCIDELRPFLH